MQGHDDTNSFDPTDPVESVDLVFLMRTLIATESLWQNLPQPLPLFLNEGIEGLADILSVV